MADVNDKVMESERQNDGYKDYEKAIINNFNHKVDKNTLVFKTDAANLWETYLSNLSKDSQTHYDCNACRSFVERYGNLVVVLDDGTIESAIWEDKDIPKFFKKSTDELRRVVNKSRITAVFVPEQTTLGIPKTGVWTHLSVSVPREMVNKYKSRTKTAGQIMAEKTEEYRMLNRAIVKYDIETVNKVVALAESGTLYRGEKVLTNAQWFKQLKEDVANTDNSRARENIIWCYVASAPTGFAHVSSSMIGTLLDDMADGMDTRLIASRFKDKMDPAVHGRSQSAPTAGGIAQAEKLIEQLGIADSLERRYARLEEIPEEHKLWVNNSAIKEMKTTAKKQTGGGVFGGITPKGKTTTTTSDGIDLPTTIMTYSKFARTVLPGVTNLEVKIDNPNHLMALVTAANEGSENILQWNNPFSWYYHGGIDAEMKRRVEEAGGRYENNIIRCSLLWNSYSDLDIHCVTPDRTHIYYGHKEDRFGGNLDIDMNAGGKQSDKPVENIRWSRRAPEGHYKFYVYNYSDRNGRHNPYKVELEINGVVHSVEGVATGTGYEKTAFEFDYNHGEVHNLKGAESSSTVTEDWNVDSEFVKVNAIVESPNLWGDKQVKHVGSHTFFILDGVKDTSEGKGRGFFNETLKSELYEIRKTLEAYTAQTPIEGTEDATACGVGYSDQNDWNLILKVTKGTSTQLIKIDRFD